MSCRDSLLESQSLSMMVWGKNIARVRVNGQICMALLDNGVQINTITPSFVKNHSLEVGPISDLVGQ